MEVEQYYKEIGEVYCPYLKERVCFNSKGWEHLGFKTRERPRPFKDQLMRLKLLHLAPLIIRSSHTLQGMREIMKFERVRVNSRTDTVLKQVKFFEFIALVRRDRVKIVIKQIEGGEKFFWSIIPFWGMDKETKSRIFHEGDPEED